MTDIEFRQPYRARHRRTLRERAARAVVVWAGLDSGDPIAFGNSMSAWNDSHRKNFAEIADLIDGIKP